jgi:tetratricopeptide (TPR) repeat protein
MGEIYLRMGNLDQSVAKYREAFAVKPDFYIAYINFSYVLALKEEYDEAFRCLDSVIAKGPSPYLRASGSAWKMLYCESVGRYREASHIFDQISGILRENDPLRTGPLSWIKAWRDLSRGATGAARKEMISFARAYAHNSPSTPVTNMVLREALLAYIDRKAGEMDSAGARIARAKSAVPSLETGEVMIPPLVGMIDGEVLLSEGYPDSAIRAVRAIPEIGPSMIPGLRMFLYNVPPERDVVARAFLKEGERDSAIAEYERLIRVDPASRERRLINPRYHYRLAKLYEEKGSAQKARSEYRKFLELWKDADRGLPELNEAQTRLARLLKQP